MAIETIVMTVLYLLVVAAVIAILWYTVTWCQSEWGGPDILWKVIRTVIIVGCCFLLIFILLGLAGRPILTWGGKPWP